MMLVAFLLMVPFVALFIMLLMVFSQWCFSMEPLVKVLLVILTLFDGVGDQMFMGVV